MSSLASVAFFAGLLIVTVTTVMDLCEAATARYQALAGGDDR